MCMRVFPASMSMCSQPSVTLVPGDRTTSSGFLEHCGYVEHIHKLGSTYMHKIKMNESLMQSIFLIIDLCCSSLCILNISPLSFIFKHIHECIYMYIISS